MENKIFDPARLEKLNNPERSADFPAELVISLANINKPGVIIDLGAGTGFFSIPFAKLFQDCTIYACDISDVMLNWINMNVRPEFPNIITVKTENDHIPLNDNIADLIFMVNLHHELENPDRVLKECNRLLKSNGKTAISDWRKEESDHGPAVDLRYNPGDVKNQLYKAGFNNFIIRNDLPNNFLIIADKTDI